MSLLSNLRAAYAQIEGEINAAVSPASKPRRPEVAREGQLEEPHSATLERDLTQPVFSENSGRTKGQARSRRSSSTEVSHEALYSCLAV